MDNLKKITTVATLVLFACACSQPAAENKAGIKKSDFEKVIDGKQVSLYTLTNANGVEMNVTNYGGKVVSLMVPDKDGKFVDVEDGYKTIAGYEKSTEIYFGAAIGRYGNRIAKGKFTLDSVEYTLATNNGPNHLHGGPKGFHAVVWDAKQLDKSTLELSYLAADGEEGYPGNLKVVMTYKLTDDNAFEIDYKATTDKATVLNLTHHSYFNLSGESAPTITDHIMYIDADSYTPTDDGLIPTGVIAPVEGTPMDFRTPTSVGERINADFEALKLGKGYDHNYILNKHGEGVQLAARVESPVTGIVMEVLTDQPAIQFYAGNFMNGSEIGKSGKPYNYRGALCLETQHYPDSPNHPEYPSTILRPGETYTHTCIYKFSVKK